MKPEGANRLGRGRRLASPHCRRLQCGRAPAEGAKAVLGRRQVEPCPDDHRRVADASARLKLAQAWDTDVPPWVLVCSAEAVRDEVG
jgi:hypothetical protein